MFVNSVQRRCWSRSSSLLKRLSSTSAEPRKTVYLRNLPFQTNIKQIEQLAGRYGALARVTTPPDQWNRPAGFGYVSFQKAEDAQRFCEAVNRKHGEGLTVSDGHERDVTAELVEEHTLKKRPMPDSKYLHLTRFLVPPAVEEIQAHLTKFGSRLHSPRPFVDVEFRTHAAAVEAYEELQRNPIIFDGRQISVDFGVKTERSTPTKFLPFRGTLRVTRQEEEFLEMLKPHDALVRGVKFYPPAEGRSYISGLIECTSKAAAADIKKAFGDKIMLEYSFRTKFLEFTVKDAEIARKEDLVELFKPYGSTIQGVELFPPRPDRQSLSGRIEFTYTRAAIEFQAAVGERLEMKYVKPPEGQDDGAETLSLSSSSATQKTMISDRIVCLENLPPHATEERVKEIASAYGAIARVTLPRRADGQPAGVKAFHEAIMGKEEEGSGGSGKDGDGISMDGQRLTARLVEEYQKPPSGILHMTGFGTRPMKAVLIRFFEGFEDDIVDVVIMPPRVEGSSSERKAGFIKCNDASAAATILEACQNDDRIRLGYRRAHSHTNEAETGSPSDVPEKPRRMKSPKVTPFDRTSVPGSILTEPSAPSTSSPQLELSNPRFAAVPGTKSRWGRGGPVLEADLETSRTEPPEPSKLRFAEPPEMLSGAKWAKGGPVLKPTSPGLKIDHAASEPSDAAKEWEDILGLDMESEEEARG
ncbi:Protein phosphatase PP2A regulatory subunit B [Marasmius crinis-equi]|uniref:Protein phosphatase PP2A regulatory subunit B n=1 Tax=Marasmius crinis-equi TaxID=585013 RepID=A0ABR3FCG1_9AGAR